MKRYLPLLFLFVAANTFGQEKKPLTTDLYDGWNKIDRSSERISDNGQWVAYEVKPGKGDGTLHVTSPNAEKEQLFPRGTHPHFSPSNEFVAFNIKFTFDSIRQMKLDGKKPEKELKDSLGIYVLGKETIKVPNIKSFAVPKNGSNWMAYWHEQKKEEEKKEEDSEKGEEEETEETESDTTITEAPEPKKKKKKKDHKAFTLSVHQPSTGKVFSYPEVSEYSFSDNGKLLTFITLFGDSIDSTAVYAFNTEKQELMTIAKTAGIAKNAAADYQGEQVAYLFTADTSKRKMYALHYWDGKAATAIVDSASTGMPENWNVNTNGKLYFSENGKRLFFGTAEKPEPYFEDTIPKDEKPVVDVWSWTDNLLQPMQLLNKKKEEKRTYLALYDFKQKRMFQLEDEQMKEVTLEQKGNTRYALGMDATPYEKRISWEYPSYNDFYLVDLSTGKKELLLKETQYYHVELSPAGKYLLWYVANDSSWHCKSISSRKDVNLTKKLPVNFYDELHDNPMEPGSYKVVGWTEDDKYVLINDFYDIWRLEPSGKKAGINLTNGFGRKNNTRFRYFHFDHDEPYLPDDLILTGKKYQGKTEGFYSIPATKQQNPTKLYSGEFGISPLYYSFGREFYTAAKARKADYIIWRQYSFKDYYDIWYASTDFKNPKQVSNANPQSEDYLWGTVEFVEWKSFEGRELKGLLYKPENFDPNKKYPMIVYFYERYSELYHYHAGFFPSASTIRPAHYTSNGYVVFFPDITYKTGHPGKDAYDCIVSGTEHIVKKGFVDESKIGLQGQSWGGYQTAQLVTMTDKYAAAMAGAPVSNMTSAYGGIRWGSGHSRMFQYEEGQSRLGATLWEDFELYKENSPVFHADKVKTPLLIMHNDNDGAVPWYQGIEYFVALRRLNKPVWMLNYNKDDHNLRKYPNQVDLSIRMKQFFDHYLKGEPAPKWMKEGIPAVEKGKDYGYEIPEKGN